MDPGFRDEATFAPQVQVFTEEATCPRSGQYGVQGRIMTRERNHVLM